MVRTSWTAREGAPQEISYLAQATDGTLWIGTNNGLFSFDGIGFHEFVSPPGEPAVHSIPLRSLCTSPDGSVWLSTAQNKILRIQNGHVHEFTSVDGEKLHFVRWLQPDHHGGIWGVNANSYLIAFGKDGVFHKSSSPSVGIGHLATLFIDSTNTAWLVGGGNLYRRAAGESSFQLTSIKGDAIPNFAESSDGSIWLSDTPAQPEIVNRLQRFDHQAEVLGTSLSFYPLNAALGSRDGSLWLLPTSPVVFRIYPPANPTNLSEFLASSTEGYGQNEGRFVGVPKAILQDADGNIWIGAKRGLERFQRAILVPAVKSAADSVEWRVCTGSAGNAVLANGDGQLFFADSDKLLRENTAGGISDIACGANGDVFLLVSRKGIFLRKSDGSNQPLPLSSGQQPYSIPRVFTDRQGQPFAEDATGLFRYAEDTWKPFLQGIIPGPPSAHFVDLAGDIWLANSGLIYRVHQGHVAATFSSVVLGAGPLYVLQGTTHGLVAAGSQGVGVLQNGSFSLLHFAHPDQAFGVSGIVEAADRSVWINGARGIVRIAPEELDSALADPTHLVQTHNSAEGEFTGPSFDINMRPSATIDMSGHLWFATPNGVVSVDPEHFLRPAAPPTLSVRGMYADGEALSNLRTISPNPRTVQIQYIGVSLTAPEKVIYRYMLQGLDKTWQDAGNRTEAMYTRLRPGPYTFLVEASFGDNRWTDPISAQFKILPSFYQTFWFLLLCVGAALFAVWLFITLRLRAAASSIRQRAEERANERVKIARDLHDTLLQGVQGLLLTLHVAVQRVDADGSSRGLLERALSTADQLVIEGRDRVSNLRLQNVRENEFFESIEALASKLERTPPDTGRVTQCRISRTGELRALREGVADELFMIARESLTNSWKHAEASTVTVELAYDEHCLRLICTDNGRGFDATHQSIQKTRQWGLCGMKERTDALGGNFFLETAAEVGTRIEVVLPSHLAYANASRMNWRNASDIGLRWFKRST